MQASRRSRLTCADTRSRSTAHGNSSICLAAVTVDRNSPSSSVVRRRRSGPLQKPVCTDPFDFDAFETGLALSLFVGARDGFHTIDIKVAKAQGSASSRSLGVSY